MNTRERERADVLHKSLGVHMIHPFDANRLSQVHTFLMAEAMSAGGNIRDKTVFDIEQFVRTGGQIWTMTNGADIVAVQTFEPMQGASMPWWYINNGVTHPDWRNQGISTQIIDTALRHNDRARTGYVVIYVRRGLFERLGFSEINLFELLSIDLMIGTIVRGKLRNGKEAHIFIKQPNKPW